MKTFKIYINKVNKYIKIPKILFLIFHVSIFRHFLSSIIYLIGYLWNTTQL